MTIYANDLKDKNTVEVWRMEVEFPFGKLLILGAYKKRDDGYVKCSITYEGKTGGGFMYNKLFFTEIVGKNTLIDLYDNMKCNFKIGLSTELISEHVITPHPNENIDMG